MLIQFRFQNYKSFRDDTILDLSATKITEHTEHVICLGNEKILPVTAIYGANASGKSNVIKAFFFMGRYVLESFAYGGETNPEKAAIKRPRLTPFLFDNTSKDAESSFEVYFITSEEDGCKSYNYGFVLDKDGIVEEWLNSKSKTAREYKPVFYRSRDEIDLSGLPKKSQELIRISLYDETLVVSLGAKQRIAQLKTIMDWFGEINIVNFENPIENAIMSRLIPKGFVDDKSVQKKVIDYFATFDPSIIDFNVELIKSDDENGKQVKIDAIHRMTGSDGTASIPLREESDGTLKMFALFPDLQNVLDSGGVLLVDELNARLHPLLVRAILILFLNPETNPRHAQLIFTTHDSWQLSSHLLRRDEIWFTNKDSEGVSSLYSLVDFVDDEDASIGKDASYEKNYLVGKYGAIPILHNFDMFTED